LQRFDAFRSIFPAGTVSGAPKIKAIEIVSSLEKEKRGIYAGAVGRFDFADDAMDTCIAIRTMTFVNGTAYLQAGGGIVFDSVEEDEYVETLNKLSANVSALEEAERRCPQCFILPQKLTGTRRILARRPNRNDQRYDIEGGHYYNY
jgi:anthranilate synthase component 1